MSWGRYISLLFLMGLMACSSVPEKAKSPARIQAELAHRNALLAIRDGRIESAAIEWRASLLAYQAIDDWQGQGMARLGLAQIQVRQGEKVAAEQVLMPILDVAAFSVEHKTQAAVQMAQLLQWQDGVRAGEYLQLATDSCGRPCRFEVQLLNLGAKFALRSGDIDAASRLAQRGLGLAAGNIAEAAFSLRILAELALLQNQYELALGRLEQAIVLDRHSAEPSWLLDDYRLMLEIARKSSDTPLKVRAEIHLSSLCEALACSP